MTEKDHLYALIHSMKKTEKAYFKKVKIAFGNTDSAMLQIYDEILKQEEYDEKKIIDKLGKDSFREFFSSKKYVLYNEILDVLSYSRAKNNETLWQISRMIAHAQMLKEKLLYEDAFRLLQKAHKSATDNEFFYKVGEINQQMIEILHQRKSMTDFEFAETLQNMRANSIKAYEMALNAEKYFLLSDQLYQKGEILRLTANEKVKEEMKELYDDKMLASDEFAESKTALVCFHFIMYFKYLSYEKNALKASHHLEKLIDLQEILKRFPLRSRFSQMANYVRMSLEAGLKEKSYEMLQRMKKISDEEKDNFILITYLVHLDFYHSTTGDYEGYILFHQNLEIEYQELIDALPFNKEIMDLKHCQFMYNFFTKNYKKAYAICNFLDGQYSVNSFKTGRFYEKILKLICVYEMDQYELIQSELRAIKYLLKSIENPLDVELLIFQTLEKMCKLEDDKKRLACMNEFLNTYNKSQSDEKFSLLMNIFHFPIWLESKIKKNDFKNLFFKIEV